MKSFFLGCLSAVCLLLSFGVGGALCMWLAPSGSPYATGNNWALGMFATLFLVIFLVIIVVAVCNRT
jgi:hypothetical protein